MTRIVCAYLPADHYGLGAKSLAWPASISSRFSRFLKFGDQFWFNVLDDERVDFCESLEECGLPKPAFHLIGVTGSRAADEFEHFEFKLSTPLELENEDDNFENQLVCGITFPPLRYGNRGCGFRKAQVKSFRFKADRKRPRADFFAIGAGPCLSSGTFGVSERAACIIKENSVSGIELTPIADCRLADSGYFQATVTAHAAPRDLSPFEVRTICGQCGLVDYYGSERIRYRHPPVLEDIEAVADFQAIDHGRVDGLEFHCRSVIVVLSSKMVQLVTQHSLKGLGRGFAGPFEPILTRSVLERCGVDISSL